MRRLIAGCGYLGSRAARRWQASGDEVFVLTRSTSRARHFQEQGWQPLLGDVTCPETLSPLPRVDTLLWSVGYERESGQAIHKVYVDGLRNLLGVLPDSVGRVIYISSTGVYGQTDGTWVDEATECRPTRAGGQACLAAEQLLCASAWAARTVILRLAGIYGPHRLPRLRQLQAGEPLDTAPLGLLNLIHVEDAAQVVRHVANTGSHLIQVVSKLTTVAILYFGAKAVIAGDLSVGSLVAFNMLSGRVAAPILRLSQLWQDFQQVRISVDRLADVLNTPAEPEYNPNRASLPPIRGDVTFDQVRFRYRPDMPEALRGVTLDLKAGEMLGIVGPSGSGKSTLTKLVQRLYIPEQGRVLVDGVDLALVDPPWLRRQIGVVLQENILFNRTVRENIALGDPTRPMESVMAAAQLAGAHEFILQMNHGYDTVIEERGSNLSGGQRQRLAIARALVNDPRILIFDEATSALDAESEEIIQHNLASIAKGRTVIIIAHRLSAVRQCDRIITVEAGEVTEQGTHEDLLRARGRYAQLYTKQMGVTAA